MIRPRVGGADPGGRRRAAGRTSQQLRTSRRGATAIVLAAALLGLYSATTPPLPRRLRTLLHLVPVEVPQAASATLVFASLALALLARGLRRGHRVAWVGALGALGASAVLHLLKGGDVEEATVALALAGWLASQASAFRVRPDAHTVRRAVRLAVGGASLAAGLGALMVFAFGTHSTDVPIGALVERLAGDTAIPLPGDTPFVTPALAAAGVGLALSVLVILLGPRLPVHRSERERLIDAGRARRVVERFGGDTLAYFALRDDKSWFLWGDSMVAYAVRNGVCLVSPDPIGPVDERDQTWSEFTAFADRHGWRVAVLGAGSAWVPVYEAAGMRSIYVGDEAIVDCQAFTLDGGNMKGLRGSHNRVRKAGFTVQVLAPEMASADLRRALTEMQMSSRQGDAERGFSMTLSRLFDPADTGLLLSVAFAPDGRPAAFCQWVPAADIRGWSLDLMRRRTDPDLPNGVTDFLVVETILHLQRTGQVGLGLNFAVMRAVLAGERETSVSSLERRVLQRLGESMQIESLWRYNEKFRPGWQPRYVMIDAVEHAAASGLAIAAAESMWELPVLGRFLTPRVQPSAG